MPAQIIQNPFPTAICPFCGRKDLEDPGRDAPLHLPPTDSDFDWLSTFPIYAHCRACDARFEIPKLSRVWKKGKGEAYYRSKRMVKSLRSLLVQNTITESTLVRDSDQYKRTAAPELTKAAKQFESAVRAGKHRKAAHLLRTGAGWHPLRLAAWLRAAIYHRDAELVNALLDNGAAFGWQMSWALQNRRVDMAILLLEHGADPNAPLADVKVNKISPLYPLTWAIAARQPDFFRALLAHAATIDTLSDETDTRRNVLAFAVAHECDTLLPTLLEHGIRSAYAIYVAIWKQREDIAHQLYAAGCSLDYKNKRGRTSLHCAAEYGMLWIMETWLAQRPEDVNLPDDEGATPLHLALRNQRAEAAQWLLAHGADVHAQLHTTEYQPLHEAILYTADIALIRQLLEAGADPNALTQKTKRWVAGKMRQLPAWRPLDRAICSRNKALQEELLRYGGTLRAHDG